MTTRAEAIAAAADTIASAELSLFDGTVAEAARRAYTPTGPSLAELERLISEHRARAFAPAVEFPLPAGSSVSSASHPTRSAGRIHNSKSA